MNKIIDRRLVVITPAKDESENVPEIVKAMAIQTFLPSLWIFVNDNCTDDTVNKFISLTQQNIRLIKSCDIIVCHHSDRSDIYALGEKYSRVVKAGLDMMQEYEHLNNLVFDYLGVLDCDVVPEQDYYERIIMKMESNMKLGIASGGHQLETYSNDKVISTFSSKSHAPGGFRVWRRKCFNETGYYVSTSQDSVSEARAIMYGWQVRSFHDITLRMRKRGSKFNFRYYGESAYIRWVPVWYIYLKSLKMAVSGRTSDASDFVEGYKNARLNNHQRINDPIAKNYLQNRLFYKLIGK